MGLLRSNKREQALNGRAGEFIACLALALQRWSHFALPTQKKCGSHFISIHWFVRLRTINVLTNLRPHFMRITGINPIDIWNGICFRSLQSRWAWKKNRVLSQWVNKINSNNNNNNNNNNYYYYYYWCCFCFALCAELDLEGAMYQEWIKYYHHNVIIIR